MHSTVCIYTSRVRARARWREREREKVKVNSSIKTKTKQGKGWRRERKLICLNSFSKYQVWHMAFHLIVQELLLDTYFQIKGLWNYLFQSLTEGFQSRDLGSFCSLPILLFCSRCIPRGARFYLDTYFVWNTHLAGEDPETHTGDVTVRPLASL